MRFVSGVAGLAVATHFCAAILPSMAQIISADESSLGTWDQTPGGGDAWVERPPSDMPGDGGLKYNVWRAVPANASLGRTLKFGDLTNTYIPGGGRYFRTGDRSIQDLLTSQGQSPKNVKVGDSSYTAGLTLGEVIQANNGKLPPALARELMQESKASSSSGGGNLDRLKQVGGTAASFIQTISNDPVLKEIPLAELASGDFQGALDIGIQRGAQEAIKYLPADFKDLPVGSLAGALVSGDYKGALTEALNYGGGRLAQEILKSDALKNLPIGAIAKDLPLSELGNIISSPIATLPRVASQYLSKIPGFKNTTVVQAGITAAIILAKGDVAVKLDVAYAGKREQPSPNAFTGGTPDNKPTPTPCTINSAKKGRGKTHNCAHFEMGYMNMGANKGRYKGKQMVDGQVQQTKGGKGILGKVNGGWEPTGWKPWGDVNGYNPAKLSLKNIKEYPGKDKRAESAIQLDLQICVKFWGKTTCTPHFIPVPTPFKARQNEYLLLMASGAPPKQIQDAIDAVQNSPAQCDLQRQVESGSAPKTGTGTPLPTTSTQNSQKNNQSQYLARIAAGESSGGTNLGAVPGPGSDAPYGEYQFRASTRQAVLNQYPNLDAWSPDKATRDKAALAWIGMYGNEIGVDLLGSIQKGDFATADRALGKNQFTSLPGGSEASPVWNKPSNLQTYGSVQGGGNAPQIASTNPCTTGGVAGAGGIPGTGKGTGAFLYPVDAGIGSPFGPRWGKDHNGVDLFVPMNTPVKASRGGVVVDSENGCAPVGYYASKCGGGYGNLIQVRHDDGSSTFYAHNTRTLFKPGDKVDQGQVIAYSGSSGSSFGPHVHFEVRTSNGTPVDPTKYLTK